MQNILVIGAGYSGTRLAAAHVRRGDAVTATQRSSSASSSATEAGGNTGWTWLALDLDEDNPAQSKLPEADRVYYTAPPDRAGTRDLRLRRLLEQLPGKPVLVYFSTTGVYGDVEGKQVDEDAMLQPNNDRSRRRADAESAVHEWTKARNATAVILRVAGIYGPGRLPLQRLQEHRPVLDPAVAGFSNRIHVDDLVQAAIASADLAASSGNSAIYNVADGNPTTSAEFLDAAADLAGLPRPERIGWQVAEREFSGMALSFMRDNKRVDAHRLMALPGFKLRYPDFRDGLRASLEEERKAG